MCFAGIKMGLNYVSNKERVIAHGDSLAYRATSSGKGAAKKQKVARAFVKVKARTFLLVFP